jgi:hypothetical protein
VKISYRFAALESLDKNVDINSVWENLRLSLPILPFRAFGVCLVPRLPLLLRITVYSKQVISLALEARYLGQLDSQYLYPLGSPDGPAIPPDTGCSF